MLTKLLSFCGGGRLIARIWHGHAKPEHSDTYEVVLKPESLPGISKGNGYRGSYLLRRQAGNEVEFITIMLGHSMDTILRHGVRDCSGPDERQRYLSSYDANAATYEIASM